jgi:hypothetical protein
MMLPIAAYALSAIVLFGATATYAQTPPAEETPSGGTTAPAASGSGLSNDGIFGCRGAQQVNIGTITAIGGVYVPVSDAAVTLNTGYLVYKECVLDGVVAAIKNDIASGLQSGTIRAIETSRGGNKQYYTNREDLRQDFDAILINAATAMKSGTMCTAYRDRVASAVARNYYATTRESEKESLCPFVTTATEREALVAESQPVNWSSWNRLIEPRGYEIGTYYIEQDKADGRLLAHDYDIREQLRWGNGFFPAFDNASDPLNRRVITPSSVIANSLQQMLGVGTQILVNANEIDQINGSLQAGLQSSIVADTIRGLAGFSRSQNGQPSYLDRMNSEASGAVRTSAVNVALSVLAAKRQVETLFKTAKESLAAALTDAITTLRREENICWNLIIEKVQQRAAGQGVSLTIATTTEDSFAQKTIEEHIQPLATVAIRDLRDSEQALGMINQLITDVSNTASAATQRSALERLDSMVANNQLHSAAEAQEAQTHKDEATAALDLLIEEILKEWKESSDSDIGWCNVNNDAIITMWFERWRRN